MAVIETLSIGSALELRLSTSSILGGSISLGVVLLLLPFSRHLYLRLHHPLRRLQVTMLHLTALLAFAASASAHYTFPSLIAAGASTPEWKYVRQWTNYQSNGPVTDVSTVDIRCNVGGAAKQASGIQTVSAGSKVGFTASPNIYHPGPLMAYMAKVPAGKTAADWDGSGSVWFKIFEQGPNFGASLTWPSNGI